MEIFLCNLNFKKDDVYIVFNLKMLIKKCLNDAKQFQDFNNLFKWCN